MGGKKTKKNFKLTDTVPRIKLKINFSEVEGLENTSFRFEDHLFLEENCISLLCNPLPISLTQLSTLELSVYNLYVIVCS